MSNPIPKIKAHLHNNKRAYIIGSTSLAVGVFGGVFLASGKPSVTVDSWKFILFNWKPVTHNEVSTVLVRRGHPGNIIKCIETGELFASQQRAANVMGVAGSELSKHLRGKNPHVKGYTFERLGEAI